MSTASLLQEQLQGLRDEVANTLKDLSDAQLNWRPNDKAHSMGFALWHALRVWDWDHMRMGGGAELYFSAGWEERLGHKVQGKGARGLGIGSGFTYEEVGAMPLRGADLLAYLDALWTRTAEYLARVSEGELAREVPHPFRAGVMHSPLRVLAHTISHTYMHIGEAQYARGLM